MDERVNIGQFLDGEGKVTKLPRKLKPKLALLEYLAGKFEYDRIYSEKEINAVCDEWHTFSDYFLLRRELVDFKFLGRERDGSKYWRVKAE